MHKCSWFVQTYGLSFLVSCGPRFAPAKASIRAGEHPSAIEVHFWSAILISEVRRQKAAPRPSAAEKAARSRSTPDVQGRWERLPA